MRKALPGDGAATTAVWPEGTSGWPEGTWGWPAPPPPSPGGLTLLAPHPSGFGTPQIQEGRRGGGVTAARDPLPWQCPQTQATTDPPPPKSQPSWSTPGGAHQPAPRSPSHRGPGVPPLAPRSPFASRAGLSTSIS